jgi:hypothetical protein
MSHIILEVKNLYFFNSKDKVEKRNIKKEKHVFLTCKETHDIFID